MSSVSYLRCLKLIWLINGDAEKVYEQADPEILLWTNQDTRIHGNRCRQLLE